MHQEIHPAAAWEADVEKGGAAAKAQNLVPAARDDASYLCGDGRFNAAAGHLSLKPAIGENGHEGADWAR